MADDAPPSLAEVHACDNCACVAAHTIEDEGRLCARYCDECLDRFFYRLREVARMISLGTPPDIALAWVGRHD